MDRVKQRIGYWNRDTLEFGLNGRGICCAVLDTGVFPHPDLAGRIVGFQDFVNGRKRPYDDSSHGTHVCGILAGDGKKSGGQYAGMAPGSRILMLKVLDKKGGGSFCDIFSGMEWLLKHYREYDVRIVNLSIGALRKEKTEQERYLLALTDALWDEGMVVVAAAGNYGPKAGSVAIPGSSRKIITVGSSEDRFSPDGRRGPKSYSGRGPTAECVMKPDVVAPGSGIISCGAGKAPYVKKSGTSMSTPVASGAIALLLSKYPGLDNRSVKLRLRERCARLALPENQQGWGEINVKKLLK